MKSTDIIQPAAMATPIAISGSKDTIPQEQADVEYPWYCSIEEGFPDITMTALKQGGKPPRGQGMNGLLNLISDQKVYLQNGGIITYNADVAEAIGGYPQGAKLAYINNGIFKLVESVIDDNSNNFVTNPSLIDGTIWREIKIGADVPVATDRTPGIVQPDGETITIDNNGVITATGSSSLKIGTLIESLLPLIDDDVHLLDGALIQGSGVNADFVDYIAQLYNDNPTANYFAQEEEIAFSQPVLSANGTLGGDSFAISASSVNSSSYAAYYAFDSNNSTQWLTTGTATASNPQYMIFYNPAALKVTNLQLTNRLTYSTYATAGNVYGSNDNSTWTILKTFTNAVSAPLGKWSIDLSNNTNYYKYYKIEFTNFSYTQSDAVFGLTQIDITAIIGVRTPEQVWQNSVTTYGICAKFVYDSVNNTVRLPKLAGHIYGITNIADLGNINEAQISLDFQKNTIPTYVSAAADAWRGYIAGVYSGADGHAVNDALAGIANFSNPQIEIQSANLLYYIVIANSTKTEEIEVDIDEVVTDLNGKADTDLGNISASQSAKNEIISWGMPDYSAVIDLSPGTYTPSVNGYIYGSHYYAANSYVSYNGLTIGTSWSTSIEVNSSYLIPVVKGETYTLVSTVSTSGSTSTLRFFPMKGAN